MNILSELKDIEDDSRYERNMKEDIKTGLDLLFELKEKIDLLHPVAKEIVLRLAR